MTEKQIEGSADHWSSQTYEAAASFVPKLATKVLKYLDPKPTDRILDLGCGDGPLTLDIAAIVTEGEMLGLDSSPSMIGTANQRISSTGVKNCRFLVEDCSSFSDKAHSEILNGSWDKVFSNAALHWILRRPETRMGTLEAAHAALKPGGTFVFEMGGAGNVAETCPALISALVAQGFDIADARQQLPWFYPSETWMRTALKKVGFEVDLVELEYRPTKLTPKNDQGTGGLEGWIRLFCASIFQKVPNIEEAVSHTCALLEWTVNREEDNSQWLGYARLRAIARRKA